MQKHIHIGIGFMGLAIAVGGLLYINAPKQESSISTTETNTNRGERPVLEATSAPITQQEDSTFNQTNPSLVGTVVSIDGRLVGIDVVEQKIGVPGVVTTRYRVRVVSALPRELSVGQTVEVFISDISTLTATEVSASRLIIRPTE